MTLRGNFTAFYFIELLSGILTAVLFYFFGDIGLLGLIIFFAGLILTMKKDVDEREIYISYKINSYEGILIGVILAVTYFKFPEVNWFYVFIVSALIIRGVIGLIAFKSE